MEEAAETAMISRLKWLIKQNRNEEFLSVASNAKMLQHRGTALLHAAALSNNVSIVDHLLALGCNVNSRDSRGQTALVVALSYNSFQVVHSLLSHDAEIWRIDAKGRSALQICFEKRRRAPDFVVEKLFEAMNKCELSTQQIIEELADCSLDHLLLLKNAEVLGLVLDRQTSISRWESRALLDRAMKLNFQENVKVLLKRGPNSSERRRTFFERVTRHIINPKTYPYLFRRLVDWEVIDRPMLSLSVWFFESQKEYMRRALLDLGVAQYARRKLGLELLARSCHNPFADVARRLRQGHLGGSGLDLLGFGALHWAAMGENPQAVALLLDHGANPNLRDRCGRTPLFYANDEKTVELLLDAGADVQLLDDNGNSAFRERRWSEYLAAHMSILQLTGGLRPELCEALKRETRRFYMRQLGKCRLDFEWMSSRRVVGADASLLDVLVDAPEEIARYVKDEDTAAVVLESSRERKLSMPAHATMIANNLVRALDVHRLRPVAAEFFRGVLHVADSRHLVIRRIVGYLTYVDLVTLQKIKHS